MIRPAVLVMDSDDGARDLLRYHLEARGIRVFAEATGDACIARLREGSFDAILLEVPPLGAVGCEILRRVRALDCKAPIIVLSSGPNGAAAATNGELGIACILKKPFGLAEVNAALRRVGIQELAEPEGLTEEAAQAPIGAGLAESDAAPRKGRGHCVLVLDDEEGIRDSLRFALEGEGYQALCTASVAEALELIERAPVEVLVCDIRMPGGLSGIDCLKRAKALRPEIEVIMETGYATVESTVEALRLGAFDYLRKPVRVSELLVAVERAVERRTLRCRAALEEWTRAIFSSLDLGALAPLAERAVAEVSGSDGATLVLPPAREGDGSSGAAPPGLARLRARLFQSALAGPVRLMGSEAAALAEGLEAHARCKTALLFPLARVRGLLFLSRRSEHAYSSAELELTAVIGAQIALAVENALLHGELGRRLEELQRSRQELVRAEKLSALGGFVAGIAHELNNPLTGVFGFAALMAQAPAIREDAGLRSDLGRVVECARRCQEIVARLVEFARIRPVAKEEIDVNAVVQRAAARRADTLANHGIALELRLATGEALVLGNETTLEQALGQILLNAEQAIAEAGRGGKISVESRVKEETVEVAVRDDGPGMAPSVLKRVFEPFFTTKAVGRGSGLGLCAAHGVVRDHGGEIRVESELGKGATFTVVLPLTGPPPEASGGPALEGAKTARAASPRVLVADDEETIRDVIRAHLSRAGIEVIAVSDGDEALDRLRRERYDAFLCDLRMPRVGGRVVYAALEREQPDMIARTVLLTGGAVAEDSTAFLTGVWCPVLAKPFSLEDLDRALRRILPTDARGGREANARPE